ncbi:EexN family lipoprotein [Phenylobacterium sp. LjRoot219]|uniref:EexN family lipoprotein n=1 Tax=Phenylobacterium sp. LjRoot219 TaxID=3342283 RepID=UPI003F501F18
MKGTHTAALTASFALLASCSPEPRSASYFEAHPGEIAKIVSACRSGLHGGEECTNAQTADAKLRSDARLALYKSGFE